MFNRHCLIQTITKNVIERGLNPSPRTFATDRGQSVHPSCDQAEDKAKIDYDTLVQRSVLSLSERYHKRFCEGSHLHSSIHSNNTTKKTVAVSHAYCPPCVTGSLNGHKNTSLPIVCRSALKSLYSAIVERRGERMNNKRSANGCKNYWVII
ncbi:hypothetical protein TNCT_41341 [Trichonephila clavata]|uniref:Uncharacterized protein n=1 Tax=Trichonephila clavata TaxID=2740835 RepID=A0A8X6G9N8_TRICU|nr:hypothetical protein TNCT_41341 [Trichonephila clavata]